MGRVKESRDAQETTCPMRREARDCVHDVLLPPLRYERPFTRPFVSGSPYRLRRL